MSGFKREELRFLFNTKTIQTPIFGNGMGLVRCDRLKNRSDVFIVSNRLVILNEELHERWLIRLKHQRTISSSAAHYHLNTRRNRETTKAMELLIREFPIYDEKKIREFLKLAELNSQKKPKTINYKKMPKGVNKDNSDGLNLKNGCGGTSSIRYPKKNRKTAWKRFYNLFPHLKNNNDGKVC